MQNETVVRPWGCYTTLTSGKGYLIKVIEVNAGEKLSLQSHEYRSEHWVVLDGVATVYLGDKKYQLNCGESIDIPVKEKHSLENSTKDILKIAEVQKGDILSEDDIKRYEDKYGRV